MKDMIDTLGSNLSKTEIEGIKLEQCGHSWEIKSKKWICHDFVVTGPMGIKRDDLYKLVGKELFGKRIQGVESVAIENQYGKIISLAVDAKVK